MKSAQVIRREFIAFFESKGHKFVRSSPVVPLDDPTLLFANAGMNQFKDIFLGTGSRDYNRAVNSQKCIRASGKHNDLEDVGRDNYHHTFFEMLGNWSFGDYFKADAISWAWELLVDHWGLPADKLYATVFEGHSGENLEPDLEAEKLWLEKTSLPPERVYRCGKKDNFWEMGEFGPCGPCSEIHMDLGPGTCPLGDAGKHQCDVNVDGCWRFIELWNLVFVQFNRLPSGELEKLPSQHVDTGMGLERVVRVLQGKASNYDSDLFTPVLEALGEMTDVADAEGEPGVAYRVIADHLRSLSFAIADGALPSNEGRGYVLRRMLRRAARFGKVLGMEEPFIYRLVPVLVKVMGEAFPEIAQRQEHVARVIQAEEESFSSTLTRGLEVFAQVSEKMIAEGTKEIPGEDAFKLYDTFGFPADLTTLMAEEKGLSVDMAGFETHMEAQRAKAKAGSQAQAVEGDWVVLSEGPHSAFVGYEKLTHESAIHAYSLEENAENTRAKIRLVLEETPFYPESGGQVADQGVIKGENQEWLVVSVLKDGDRIVHICEGPKPESAKVVAGVNPADRGATVLNHTATHLLHAALKETLGEHVNQAGSVVSPEMMRFDYTHFEKPTEDQLEKVEKRVNQVIRENQTLNIFETGYDEAVSGGVTALFGEKYGDKVRVVEVGAFSQELCGGCHVQATGDIGIFRIASESAISAGVRRIVGHTGERAESELRGMARMADEVRHQLNVPVGEISDRLQQLLEEKKKLEREVKNLKKTDQAKGAGALIAQAETLEGAKVLSVQVEVESVNDLRALADSVRKELKSGVALLGAVIEGKGSLLCVVTDDWVKQGAKAGEIVSQVAALADGKGGGPPHMATAGAKALDKLPQAVSKGAEMIAAYLAQLKT